MPADEPTCVLIAIRDRSIAEGVAALLDPEAFDVYLATSGAAAIDVLHREPVGVVVCDHGIGDGAGGDVSGMDVFASADELRAGAARIALVEASELPQSQRALDEGRVDRLVLTPWPARTVERAISESAAMASLARENARLRATIAQGAGRADSAAGAEPSDGEPGASKGSADPTRALRSGLERLKSAQAESEQAARGIAGLLLKTLEMDRPGSELHAKRVSIAAVLIGRAAGVAGRDLAQLQLAALLHEIGWSPALFGGASDGLTERRAAVRASKLLAGFPGMAQPSQAIGSVHDRFDGRGSRRSGDQIPLWSRIIAVADVLDVAAHRDEWPGRADVIAGLRGVTAESGEHLDPELVRHLGEIDFAGRLHKTAWEHAAVVSSALSAGMVLAAPVQHQGETLFAEGTGLNGAMIAKIRSVYPDQAGARVKITCDLRLPAPAREAA